MTADDLVFDTASYKPRLNASVLFLTPDRKETGVGCQVYLRVVFSCVQKRLRESIAPKYFVSDSGIVAARGIENEMCMKGRLDGYERHTWCSIGGRCG
jgi:hypothetical protein